MHRRSFSARGRRAIGWILSALVIFGYASPQAALLRELPGTLALASGQEIRLTRLAPLSVAVESGDVQALSSADETLTLRVGDAGESRAVIRLFGLPIRDVTLDVSDDRVVYPGGQAVGVALHTKGVLIVGMSDLTGALSPARLAGLKTGDLLTAVGGVAVEDASHLTQLVARGAGQAVRVEALRGGDALSVTLEPKLDSQTGAYRIGAWVRDSTAGVGTLSFYTQPDANGSVSYGALGHPITDGDTQQVLTVGIGRLMKADIVDVRKGQKGVPGELKGSFLREGVLLGDVDKNNALGIYGTLKEAPAHPLYPEGLKIGRRDGVRTGAASILCTLGPDGMAEYAVEIVEVARQTKPGPRSMIVKVTDERLLARTGGIVQGMSGSPILQDGRLIGAVTHVYVNDPTMGYGLYIEWMLGEGVR